MWLIGVLILLMVLFCGPLVYVVLCVVVYVDVVDVGEIVYYVVNAVVAVVLVACCYRCCCCS